MRRVVAYVGQFAGPLFIIMISVSCGLVIGAMFARH